jgi:hypothetical protein
MAMRLVDPLAQRANPSHRGLARQLELDLSVVGDVMQADPYRCWEQRRVDLLEQGGLLGEDLSELLEGVALVVELGGLHLGPALDLGA